LAIFPLDLHAVSGETARRRARNGGFVAFWEVDRMSRGLGNEIIEMLEEAKQYFADPSGSSKSVGTIGYVGRAKAN
jgi:hypothetical protein